MDKNEFYDYNNHNKIVDMGHTKKFSEFLNICKRGNINDILFFTKTTKLSFHDWDECHSIIKKINESTSKVIEHLQPFLIHKDEMMNSDDILEFRNLCYREFDETKIQTFIHDKIKSQDDWINCHDIACKMDNVRIVMMMEKVQEILQLEHRTQYYIRRLEKNGYMSTYTYLSNTKCNRKVFAYERQL